MSRRRGPREISASFGPRTLTPYPISAFSKIPYKFLDDLWRLVGPTVNENHSRPLWEQFCAAYYEGLNHGANAMREHLLETGESEDCRDAL